MRRAAGLSWLAAWIVLLYGVSAPWRELGGIVDERLRWLEGFVLVVGLVAGFTLGRFGRDAAGPGSGRTHLDVLRYLLLPVAALTAVALLALTWMAMPDPVGVVVTGFLAYWAGLDLAFGAVPLLDGKPYHLSRPVDPEPEVPPGRSSAPWDPPWERY